MSAGLVQKVGDVIRERPREAGAASAGAFVLLIIASIVLAPDRPVPPGPTANVRVGRFVDTLVESGTIGASRFRLYGSDIGGGPAKIIEIAREGSSVVEGDVLIRFDDTAFRQELDRELGALGQAEADVRRASEDVRLSSLAAEGRLQVAQQRIDSAETDLANQEDGRGRLSIAEARVAAANAERDVERTDDTYQDLIPLLAEGFITRAELDQAKRDWERAVEQKELADLRLSTLLEYERPAALNQARSRVDTANDELGRQQEEVAANLEQSRAELLSAQGYVQEVRARISILEERIAKTVVRAGGPGLVVYRSLFFGSEPRKPQVGDEVWSNQPVIALPDASELIVDTSVREIDLHKLSTSQRVEVTVDAYPDIRLPASVQLVGALAQEDPDRAGTKFFPVTVHLTETDPRLRTGMTARVEIEVASRDDATIVPTQAIFEDRGERYCVVFLNGQTERRLVTVAADNGVESMVEGNLQSGEVLLLVDPDGAEVSAGDR